MKIPKLVEIKEVYETDEPGCHFCIITLEDVLGNREDVPFVKRDTDPFGLGPEMAAHVAEIKAQRDGVEPPEWAKSREKTEGVRRDRAIWGDKAQGNARIAQF